ncbi:hypothetical protein ACFX14_032192 [Malus domestica]
MVRHICWQGLEVDSPWAKDILWEGPLLGLPGLARAKGTLRGWGRGLRRWGAMLDEQHGSCLLGSWS